MTRQTQFLNLNKYRRYPFIEDTKLNLVGGIEFPNGVILDFRGVNYIQAAAALSLTKIQVAVVGGIRIGTFTFSLTDIPGADFNLAVPENADFPFESTVYSTTQHMTVIFGADTADFLSNAEGEYTFVSSPLIEPTLIGFQNKHRITSIQASGAGQAELSGDVYLEEGYNCKISIDDNVITIAGVKGAGAGVSCDRIDPTVPVCGETLLRLNGMAAGDRGDFMLVAGTGVKITPDKDNHTLIISGPANLTELLECG